MRIVLMNPIESSSYRRNHNNIYKNRIIVGKCEDDIFISDMFFSPILIKKNEVLVKAVIKMYCKEVSGLCCHTNVCIDRDHIQTDVFCEGNYEWNVTELVRKGFDKQLKFSIYANDIMNCCAIAEFETSDLCLCPVLELIIDEEPPEIEHNVVNIVKDYMATNVQKYSDWIDCISLSEYYYFIKNCGTDEIEISIEISPDKKLVLRDSDVVRIAGNQVHYLQPMRYSRFVRTSFINSSFCGSNKFELWFQGKY